MSLIGTSSRIAVSSVLNRDTKQYGKKFMFDGNDDTCWNSDQGDTQWIKLAFDKDVNLNGSSLQLTVQFQGGFSSKLCIVTLIDTSNGLISTANCYPEDINSAQQFVLDFPKDAKSFSSVQLDFKNATDFYGRITIYHLDIMKIN